MIFAALHCARELKSISSSSSCKDNIYIARNANAVYIVYQAIFVHPADDIVECAWKLEKAVRHLPTEQSQPILVSQHAFAIEPAGQSDIPEYACFWF